MIPLQAIAIPRSARWSFAGLRAALGATFLWAFLDKLLGLGYATPAGRGWVDGGSPTKGYLSSSFGPLGAAFEAMAGHPAVDALFMLGLLAVGLSLTVGFLTPVGGWSGVAMVLLMYASHPAPWAEPHGTNPLVDDHVVQAFALAAVAVTHAGTTLGLDRWLQRAVARHPRAAWLV